MFYQPSIRERRTIRALAKLIGENEIPTLAESRHFAAQRVHVYSHITDPVVKRIFFVSVWTERKSNPESKCIYADNVNLFAYDNMKDYSGKLSMSEKQGCL
jgi:hypothetical protein